MDNNLYFEDNYTKNQLLEVSQTKTFEKVYALQYIAEKYGHTTLRFPPYFCVFNPIELISGKLKEDWQKRIKKVILVEKDYMEIGHFHIKFIIDLNDDSDSETENMENELSEAFEES